MNPVQKAILDRRSIRAYQKEQLTEAQLNALLDAALASPSAMNSQPWHFTVVQDQALIDRVHEAAKARILKSPDPSPRFEDPDFHIFYHAPTVVFISAAVHPGLFYGTFDCGIAVQNIALAAEGLGLGSVILGMPRAAFEGERGDEFRAALGFPEGYDFKIAISLGTPAATKPAHEIQPDKINYVR